MLFGVCRNHRWSDIFYCVCVVFIKISFRYPLTEYSLLSWCDKLFIYRAGSSFCSPVRQLSASASCRRDDTRIARPFIHALEYIVFASIIHQLFCALTVYVFPVKCRTHWGTEILHQICNDLFFIVLTPWYVFSFPVVFIVTLNDCSLRVLVYVPVILPQ